MRYNNKNWQLPAPLVPSGPANDEIWYTSSDGKIVKPYKASSLPTIVSNTYSDGKGIIKFATDVTSIGNYAFYKCLSLTSVTIPDSVTSIGDLAFWACISLTSVTIPDSVTSIGKGAFYRCISLTSVTIGNSVTSIGDGAFNACDGFSSLLIPNSVTSIGMKAFSSCRSLTSISYTGTIAQYNAITKGDKWHNGVPATVVHCTDGDTPL